MARTTTTVHSCDRCGVKVDRPRDLRRFDIKSRKPYGEIHFEVCRDCEGEFVTWLQAGRTIVVDPLVRDA